MPLLHQPALYGLLALGNPIRIVMTIGILIGLLVVCWVIVGFVRSKTREMLKGEISQAFTLNDLRKLHRNGQLSDDEYERAKEALLGVAGITSVKAEPSPRPINTLPAADKAELGDELLPPSDRPTQPYDPKDKTQYNPRDDAPGKNE
jgi:hypothetical protein